MADGIVQVPVDSTGKKIDTSELTVGAATVERQRIVVADPTTAANLATVTGAGALKTDSSATTQPVSAGSLPLPSGAATETTLGAVNTATGAQADAEAAGNGSIIAILKRIRTLLNGGLPTLASGRLPVDPSGVTSPVSGTVAATQSGNWNTSARASSTSTLSSVAANASSVSLLASNANRLAVVIINDGTANLFIKLGATASTSSYSYLLGPKQTLELPTAGQIIYTGAIDGIWDVANGNARITELT